MDQDENQFERMEAYLDGNMSGVERNQFEQELASSPELHADFEVLRRVHEGFRAMKEYGDLKAQLIQTEAEISRNDNRGGSGLHAPRKKWVMPALWGLAAACVIILIGLAVLFRNVDQPYSRFLPQEMGAPVVMASKKSLDEGMNAFKSGQFEEALKLFEGLMPISPSDTLTYHAALCHLYLDQEQAAFDAFSELSQGAGPFQEKSKFYMGLIEFERGHPTQARGFLVPIQQARKDQYGVKAGEMLRQMEKSAR